MTSRFFLILAALSGLLLMTTTTARAETLADTYKSSAQKNFGTNKKYSRKSLEKEARTYAERSARNKQNKNRHKHRRDGRNQKQSTAVSGVNE